jgi:hypothetical protein
MSDVVEVSKPVALVVEDEAIRGIRYIPPGAGTPTLQ